VALSSGICALCVFVYQVRFMPMRSAADFTRVVQNNGVEQMTSDKVIVDIFVTDFRQ
jgi:hypothetical protein